MTPHHTDPPPVSGRIMVPFEGDGAGEAELSWGQWELWLAMRRQRSWLPIGAALPLPAGTTLATIIGDLQFLMGRYQTARTRLRLGADHPVQVVADRGEVPLEIVDAEPDADPAAVAERVMRELRQTDYDFATEWPVRTTVIRHRGAFTHRVIVMCHLVTDWVGAKVLLAELADRDPATGRARRPVTALQPLEQARWQRTAAGRRLSDAALRRWEDILRTVSPRRFKGSDDHRRPRYWEGVFRSSALPMAVRMLAARTGIDTSSVLLALFAVAVARATGINPVVAQVVVSNRFRPGLAETVSPINQTGLCVLDLADLTVDEAVVQAWHRAMAAYKHAYYDPRALERLVDRIGRERGEEIDLACYFNDRRVRRVEVGGVAPTPELMRAAMSETTFGWARRVDDPFERLFVHVDDVGDQLWIAICADTHVVAPADMQACVRDIETVAVAAVCDATAGTGVRRPALRA